MTRSKAANKIREREMFFLMQIYLSKMEVFAILMMIDDAQSMTSETGDGWAGLASSNPELHDKISDAVSSIQIKLEDKGFTYEGDVRPVL